MMQQYFGALYRILRSAVKDPRVFLNALITIPSVCDALAFSRSFQHDDAKTVKPSSQPKSPLWDYFQNHQEGPGIWKWEHYFDIYARHLSKFVGKKVEILEIGIYSGGSLEMWRSYFGENCHIYGVDIEEACKAYENDHVSVFIGDQANRTFWSTFKDTVDGIDILIDDGGHMPEQQKITLEEMLQHIRPGGVYICEDIHGAFNNFSTFAAGLVNELNNLNLLSDNTLGSNVTQFQAAVHSIHFYPYVVVIEKHLVSPPKLSAPRHGTEWQPFILGK
jgi:SAM-dependent methyltransferase